MANFTQMKKMCVYFLHTRRLSLLTGCIGTNLFYNSVKAIVMEHREKEKQNDGREI